MTISIQTFGCLANRHTHPHGGPVFDARREPVARFNARARSLASLILCLLFTSAPSAQAGTVCGNVRDALSSIPVEKAGVFLFETSGSYTGLYAATDASGDFCIAAVPAGTYDLKVQVDHYLAAVVYGIVVDDDVSGIDIDAHPPRLHLTPPWPNPAQYQVSFRVGFEEGGTLDLVIFDAAGRPIRAWTASHARPGERTISWDFRGRDGARVGSGIYFIRVSDGHESVTRRIVFRP